MGEMTDQERDPHTITKGMTTRMLGTLMTGNHYGITVIGQKVTIGALRRRGLLDEHFRWTKLGWAVALWNVATHGGWNPDYFKTFDDLHVEALAEDEARQWDGERYAYNPNRPCDSMCAEHRKAGRLRHRIGCPAASPPRHLDLFRPTDINVGSMTYVARHGDPDVRGLVVGFPDDQEYVMVAWGDASRLTSQYAMAEAVREDPAALVRWEQRTEARLNGEPEPPISGCTVPGFRGGKIPPGWSPEHTAKLAAQARADLLTMDHGPGSLVAAAEIVDRVVKRAQYDALRTVRADVDAWVRDRPGAAIAPGIVYEMLAEAAHLLRVRWP